MAMLGPSNVAGMVAKLNEGMRKDRIMMTGDWSLWWFSNSCLSSSIVVTSWSAGVASIG